MPFKKVEHTSRTPRRGMIIGPPNSLKTTALLKLPRHLASGDDGMCHIISMPGEKGWDTLPTDQPDLKSYVWESSPAEKTSSQSVVTAVETLTFEVLSGKHGKAVSVGIDGYHKFYSYILDAVTGGDFFRGEDFSPTLYARSHERFNYFHDRVMSTPIPYIWFTAWDGREVDSPEQAAILKSKAPSHIFPDFPGKMAKRMMGEFPIVMYSNVKWGEQGKLEVAEWQLRPHGKVWGAAVKAPLEVIERLPLTIPQDFQVLEQVLQGAWEPKGGKK